MWPIDLFQNINLKIMSTSKVQCLNYDKRFNDISVLYIRSTPDPNFIMSCKDTYFGSLVVSFAIKKGGKFMECALKMDKPPNKALVIENIFNVSIKYYSI